MPWELIETTWPLVPWQAMRLPRWSKIRPLAPPELVWKTDNCPAGRPLVDRVGLDVGEIDVAAGVRRRPFAGLQAGGQGRQRGPGWTGLVVFSTMRKPIEA